MNPYAVAAALLVVAVAIGWVLVASMPRMTRSERAGVARSSAPRCGRFTRRGRYIPDHEAHREYGDAVMARLTARYCCNGVHVWVGTADGPACSICDRVQDFIQPKPEPKAEEYPLWLTLPDSGEAA